MHSARQRETGRGTEMRRDYHPTLADIEEIVQGQLAPNAVVTLYRAAYYNLTAAAPLSAEKLEVLDTRGCQQAPFPRMINCILLRQIISIYNGHNRKKRKLLERKV